MESLACWAPKVSGAALEHQDKWDSQVPQGLLVPMASRANLESKEHPDFQELQVGLSEEEPQPDRHRPWAQVL